MKSLWSSAKTIFAAIGAFIGWWLNGNTDNFIYALIVFTSVDYIFGILRVVAEKKLSNRIGARGIVKKVGIFFIIGAAYLADLYLLGGALRTAIVFFYKGISKLQLKRNIYMEMYADVYPSNSAGHSPNPEKPL